MERMLELEFCGLLGKQYKFLICKWRWIDQVCDSVSINSYSLYILDEKYRL
jgi:hypothetical protein